MPLKWSSRFLLWEEGCWILGDVDGKTFLNICCPVIDVVGAAILKMMGKYDG